MGINGGWQSPDARQMFVSSWAQWGGWSCYLVSFSLLPHSPEYFPGTLSRAWLSSSCLMLVLWVGFWTCLGSLHQMSLQRGETSLCSKQLACVSGFQALLQTLSGRLLPFPILRWSGQLPSSYFYNSCWPNPSNYGQGRRLCWAESWWVWSFF